MTQYQGAIFDLDGVIVDTAKHHYRAWKALAARLGSEFTEEDNERLKGVSRMRSLDILLEVGGLSFSEEEKLKLATEKNDNYVALLGGLNRGDLLPGAGELLTELRARGVKIALGPASRNAPMILEKLGIAPLFDAVIDGN